MSLSERLGAVLLLADAMDAARAKYADLCDRQVFGSKAERRELLDDAADALTDADMEFRVAAAAFLRSEDGPALVAMVERVAELEAMLRQCRDEMAGLPHSLGYDFTHLPKIDAALANKDQQP